jgi:hypothetical protein
MNISDASMNSSVGTNVIDATSMDVPERERTR